MEVKDGLGNYSVNEDSIEMRSGNVGDGEPVEAESSGDELEPKEEDYAAKREIKLTLNKEDSPVFASEDVRFKPEIVPIPRDYPKKAKGQKLGQEEEGRGASEGGQDQQGEGEEFGVCTLLKQEDGKSMHHPTR